MTIDEAKDIASKRVVLFLSTLRYPEWLCLGFAKEVSDGMVYEHCFDLEKNIMTKEGLEALYDARFSDERNHSVNAQELLNEHCPVWREAIAMARELKINLKR